MSSAAGAAVGRSGLRNLVMPLAVVLSATPFVFATSAPITAVTSILSAALVMLSMRRGPIRHEYGGWSRLIV